MSQEALELAHADQISWAPDRSTKSRGKMFQCHDYSNVLASWFTEMSFFFFSEAIVLPLVI